MSYLSLAKFCKSSILGQLLVYMARELVVGLVLLNFIF